MKKKKTKKKKKEDEEVISGWENEESVRVKRVHGVDGGHGYKSQLQLLNCSRCDQGHANLSH